MSHFSISFSPNKFLPLSVTSKVTVELKYKKQDPSTPTSLGTDNARNLVLFLSLYNCDK